MNYAIQETAVETPLCANINIITIISKYIYNDMVCGPLTKTWETMQFIRLQVKQVMINFRVMQVHGDELDAAFQ
jgi:hypothetical protein